MRLITDLKHFEVDVDKLLEVIEPYGNKHILPNIETINNQPLTLE